jgi:hypothetical protein
MRDNCWREENNSIYFFFSYNSRKKERIPRFLATLLYRVLAGDSFENAIFFLQLLLAVALDRRYAWNRVPPLNHFSSSYTLTNHKGRRMLYVMSMHRPGDPRQTASSDLKKYFFETIPVIIHSRLKTWTRFCRCFTWRAKFIRNSE